MISRKIKIAKWVVHFYFLDGDRDAHAHILNQVELLQADTDIMGRIEKNLKADNLDTGFTYSNPLMRESVVVVGRASSGAEFLNSYTHELRHLADDIAKEQGYQDSGELVAYLTGDISTKVADIVCALSCDHCRKSESRK